MDHEDAYDMTTYDEEIVINGDDDHYHSKNVEEILQPSDLMDNHINNTVQKPMPKYTLGELKGMRNLIAKRQRKVANRHDLFHKHGLNKRRLKHGTLQLDHLLL